MPATLRLHGALSASSKEAYGTQHLGRPVMKADIHCDLNEQAIYSPSSPTRAVKVLAAEPAWVTTGASSADDRDTTTPSSCGTDDSKAGLPESLTPAPVKNTFIHYDVQEQPDYRPCISGPAKLNCIREPAWVPLSRAMREQELQQQQDIQVKQESHGPTPRAAALSPSGSPQRRPPSQPPLGLPAAIPAGVARATGAAAAYPPMHHPEEHSLFGATVKNTFIHFDLEEDSEQPDYRPVKSGPAKLLWAPSQEEPAWIPLSQTGEVQNSEEEATHLISVSAACELPSLGSAGHALGDCKPCGHAWKLGGCSKGRECTFCHLCAEDDFRQRKKDKISRIKAEKAMRKAAAASLSFMMDSEEALAAAALESRLQPEPDRLMTGFDQELAPGELVVSYRGGRALVHWVVDLRRLRCQHRCGQSRRLALRFGDRDEVPFVFFLLPSRGDSAQAAPMAGHGKAASFQRSQALAAMQLKCTDPAVLTAEHALIRVIFAAGKLHPRQASCGHDFGVEPVCSLPPQEATWDLAAAAGGQAACCVVRADLQLLVRLP